MEQVIDLEIPPHESALVLNGRLDTDKEIKVLLSKSLTKLVEGLKDDDLLFIKLSQHNVFI